jgi:hypothetical protein
MCVNKLSKQNTLLSQSYKAAPDSVILQCWLLFSATQRNFKFGNLQDFFYTGARDNHNVPSSVYLELWQAAKGQQPSPPRAETQKSWDGPWHRCCLLPSKISVKKEQKA